MLRPILALALVVTVACGSSDDTGSDGGAGRSGPAEGDARDEGDPSEGSPPSDGVPEVGRPDPLPTFPGVATRVPTDIAFTGGVELDGSLWTAAGPEDDPDFSHPDTVVQLDAATGEVLRTVVPDVVSVDEIGIGGGFVWASTSSGVIRIDPASGAFESVALESGAADLAVTEGAVWVSSYASDAHRLSVVDPATLAVRPVELPVDSALYIFDLATDGERVWVALEEDGDEPRIDVFDAATRRRERSLPNPFTGAQRVIPDLTVVGDRLWACQSTGCAGFDLDASAPDVRLPRSVEADDHLDEGEGEADTVMGLAADDEGHLALHLTGGPDDVVDLVDPITGEVTASFTARDDHRSVALAGGMLWVLPAFDGIQQDDHMELVPLA